jgi:hypothetical protein
MVGLKAALQAVGSLGHFVDLLPVMKQPTATGAQARLLQL